MNTIRYLNDNCSNADSTLIQQVRSNLYSIGITWTDDHHGNFDIGKPMRVILSTKPQGSIDFTNPIVNECNGLVACYEHGKWRALVVPLGTICRSSVSMKSVSDAVNNGKYDIYDMLDATIMHLYYYNENWCISTGKSYDLTNKPFNKANGITMTYLDIINDLIVRKYNSFSFSKLNKDVCYTVAIRHSSRHIFDESKHLRQGCLGNSETCIEPHKYDPVVDDMNSYIMLLNAFNTKTMNKDTRHVSGIPKQQPLKTDINKLNLSKMRSYAQSAYSKYEKAWQLDQFKYKPLYGYILRPKQGSSGLPCIMIKSELYNVINRGLYKKNVVNEDYSTIVKSMLEDVFYLPRYKVVFQTPLGYLFNQSS